MLSKMAKNVRKKENSRPKDNLKKFIKIMKRK